MTAALGEVAAGGGAAEGGAVASRAPVAASNVRPVAGTGTPKPQRTLTRRATGGKAQAAAGGAATGGLLGKLKGKPQTARSRGHRALIAEFIVCLLIVALSGLTDKHKSDTPGDLIKRLTGVTALFVLLGLVSSGGKTSARASAAFGALVMLALLVSDRDVFSVIAARFGSPAAEGPAGPPDTGGGEAPGGGLITV